MEVDQQPIIQLNDKSLRVLHTAAETYMVLFLFFCCRVYILMHFKLSILGTAQICTMHNSPVVVDQEACAPIHVMEQPVIFD